MSSIFDTEGVSTSARYRPGDDDETLISFTTNLTEEVKVSTHSGGEPSDRLHFLRREQATRCVTLELSPSMLSVACLLHLPQKIMFCCCLFYEENVLYRFALLVKFDTSFSRPALFFFVRMRQSMQLRAFTPLTSVAGASFSRRQLWFLTLGVTEIPTTILTIPVWM